MIDFRQLVGTKVDKRTLSSLTGNLSSAPQLLLLVTEAEQGKAAIADVLRASIVVNPAPSSTGNNQGV